jgi:hypothetical protein
MTGRIMSDSKKASELVAELAEAVRDLPDDEVAAELRALRAAVEKLSAGQHHCHGSCCHRHCNWNHCNCWIWHFDAAIPVYTVQPYVVTGSGTSIPCGTSVTSSVMTVYGGTYA